MNNNTNREKDTEFSIYCDGGARGNPGPAAIGFVVRGAEGKPMHREAREIGKNTKRLSPHLNGLQSIKPPTAFQEK